jgi:GNAT superfamily N-acetyltransferase
MAYERILPGGFCISDDPARLDVDLVHRFLSEESYWSRGITREQLMRALASSLCFGLYTSQHRQSGFARVVSDFTSFAWLTDVFVLAAYRRQGFGRALVAAVLGHPELQGLRRWLLATHDAQPFYRSLGFQRLDRPEIFMTRRD